MNFDRVAPHYRWLETIVFGQQLQQARVAFVREIEAPRRVLMVGEGDGRFLAEFVRLHPRAKIDCLDASARMIALARARLGSGPQVSFIQADLREFLPEKDRYDLVVTHFFLDCFTGAALREVVQRLAAGATADAVWLLADFRVPEGGWQRSPARFWIRAMYLFFRLTSGLEARRLHDPAPFLRANGFACKRERTSCFGMIQSSVWQRLAE
ncbi:MAG: class I SAM-dependent methyltransferase [Chthoniobacterales bacterium]|nr:class I SAM-dependent methyltransferase [Chthoniobacterales bacterium]